jgi:hypothetical protein
MQLDGFAHGLSNNYNIFCAEFLIIPFSKKVEKYCFIKLLIPTWELTLSGKKSGCCWTR